MAEGFTGDDEQHSQTINYKGDGTHSEGEVENYGKWMDKNTGKLELKPTHGKQLLRAKQNNKTKTSNS